MWASQQNKKFADNCKYLVWKVTGESLVFYRAWGKRFCKGCTPWCLKHCYMNLKEFLKDKREFLANYLPKYDSAKDTYCREFLYFNNKDMPFHNDLSRAKYVTFFGSGTIIEKNDVDFITKTIKYYPNKIYRIFTRDLEFIEELYGQQIIFSADVDTDKKLLEKALKNKNVNIAVLNHQDNAELIKELKSKIKTVIECSKCLAGECKHLCFYEGNKHLLLENYEEVLISD
jgi:hypothetical protein